MEAMSVSAISRRYQAPQLSSSSSYLLPLVIALPSLQTAGATLLRADPPVSEQAVDRAFESTSIESHSLGSAPLVTPASIWEVSSSLLKSDRSKMSPSCFFFLSDSS